MPSLVTKIVLSLAAIAIGCGVGYCIPDAEPDNAIEELAEEVLKENSGIDIDFTPGTPEDKK